ncbi:hypothetical protein HYX13_05490 [Candidatus Woesearchaeota archaeon]|nr:hypothetical protein [Candidatus Woesearchaeota archaeon]
MEQYWMPRKLDFKNLRHCLDNYQTNWLYIRLKGSSGGTVKINQSLENKCLDFRKNKSGLYLLVDSEEVFHFPLAGYTDKHSKGFSLAYERIQPTEDGIGRMIMLGTGIDPYDAKLPEPRRSFLRHVLDDHLLEIFFKGRIPVKFHSWWQEPHWKYWTVV